MKTTICDLCKKDVGRKAAKFIRPGYLWQEPTVEYDLCPDCADRICAIIKGGDA